MPVEEVHTKVPVLYTKGSHKSKLASSTGTPVEEHQAVRLHKYHKSKLATTTDTPVEEHLTSAKTHKKKLSLKEKALLHEI